MATTTSPLPASFPTMALPILAPSMPPSLPCATTTSPLPASFPTMALPILAPSLPPSLPCATTTFPLNAPCLLPYHVPLLPPHSLPPSLPWPFLYLHPPCSLQPLNNNKPHPNQTDPQLPHLI
ncbi:hypothetical protein Pmani_039321 [Petrolisthes manimaculis]|uniref:Uncharacterized protein n=1 Tax=Petrolisthes manimaculis TaxID=1843537 RepID=A0AAE1NCT6_9EUCA|nr:hypothetical protein Pmani_039321 [Petrolisthes manimaculis]